MRADALQAGLHQLDRRKLAGLQEHGGLRQCEFRSGSGNLNRGISGIAA